MENDRVGKAIAYLRKRAGYTQKDLADRIGISDKAVSKWERGVGLPDITYLRKLSIILDTDTDSLLSGDVVHHDSSWTGVLILNSNKYSIHSDTLIYDKPLLFYLLSYYLLVGIRSITVICDEYDKHYIDNTIGNGEEYGIEINTVVGDSIADIPDISVKTDSNVMLVYGRCILYGVDQTRFFQKAMINRNQVTMLVLPKRINNKSNRIVFDHNKRIVNANSSEPIKTQYDFSDIPIVFIPSNLLKKMKESKKITKFIDTYSRDNEVYVQMLDRGFVEFEVEDWDNVQEASTFMRIVQNKCGMNVYCLEEVAWRRGMITSGQLLKLGKKYLGTAYGDYINSLIERINLN